MKKLKHIFTWGAMFFCSYASAQLPNGATAPDFTLTDINGEQHTLYEYLDQGKTVYIDFFACHCPYCWAYHNTHALSDLYDQYGPGTANDDVVVFAIELDANNGLNEFYGISGSTQGNWVAGTNYPQINPEGNERAQIVSAYNVSFYPLIYAICPDRKITFIGKKNTQQLYEHVESCGMTLGIEPEMDKNSLTVSAGVNHQVYIQLNDSSLLKGSTISLINLQGQEVMISQVEDLNIALDVAHLNPGMYILTLQQNGVLIYSGKVQWN